MSEKIFGGNRVKQLKLGKPGKEVLGSGPYEYFIYETSAQDRVRFDELASFRRFATSTSTASPAACPWVSLTCLE